MPAIFVYPNGGALYLAGQIRTDLVAAQLLLFQNNILPGSGTTAADLDECDFSGYTRLDPIVWGAVFLDPVLQGASFQTYNQWDFDGTDVSPTTNTVYGFAILNAADELVACGTFDEPIPMAAGGDSIPLTVKLNYGR